MNGLVTIPGRHTLFERDIWQDRVYYPSYRRENLS
jgi:hypothetical protein